MIITIEYKGSVRTQAGYRGVIFTASAEKISEKRCRVITVKKIDSDEVTANMSRTGAKRQAFYGYGAASNEEGKIKNISVCVIIES